MSVDQVLATVLAAYQDATGGIAAKAQALATARGYAAGRIRTDLAFARWSRGSALNPATQPVLTLAPTTWNPTWMPTPLSDRLASCGLQITFEQFATDPAVVEDTLVTLAIASVQVLDGLRAYSDAHGGTIELVQDPITTQFGDFPNDGGLVPSSGFVQRVTLVERSMS